MESILLDCLKWSNKHFLFSNSIFFAERLFAENQSNTNLKQLASVYLKSGRIRQAYEILLGAGPEQYLHPVNRYTFAMCCFRLGKYQDVLQILQPTKTNKQTLKDEASLFLLGLVCKRQNRKKEAEKWFRLSLELNPFLWTAFHELCQMGCKVNPTKIFQKKKITDQLLISLNKDLKNFKNSKYPIINHNYQTQDPNTPNVNSTVNSASISLSNQTPHINQKLFVNMNSNESSTPSTISKFPIKGLNNARRVITFESQKRDTVNVQTPNNQYGEISTISNSEEKFLNETPNTTTKEFLSLLLPTPSSTTTGTGTSTGTNIQRKRNTSNLNSQITPSPSSGFNLETSTTKTSRKDKKRRDIKKKNLKFTNLGDLSSTSEHSTLSSLKTGTGRPKIRKSQRIRERLERQSKQSTFLSFSTTPITTGSKLTNNNSKTDQKQKKKRSDINRLKGPRKKNLRKKQPTNRNSKNTSRKLQKKKKSAKYTEIPKENLGIVSKKTKQSEMCTDSNNENENVNNYFDQIKVIFEQLLNGKRLSGMKALDFFVNLGIAHKSFHSYKCKKAIDHYEKLSKKQKQSPWILSQIGYCNFELSRYQKAYKYFQAVREKARYQVVNMDIYSTVLWQLQKEVELSILSEELILIDRLSPEPWCVVGNCFSLQGDHTTAIKFFERAIQINPNFAYAYTLSGHEYLACENFEKSINCFRMALKVNDRHWNAYAGLGLVYFKQENFELAIEHFKSALHISQNSSVLHCFYSMALYAKNKIFRAVNALNTAIKLDPNNVLAIYKKATILFDTKKYDKSLQILEKLHKSNSKEAGVHLLMGKIYKKKKMWKLAISCFSNAIELDPKANGYLKKEIELIASERENVEDDSSDSNSNSNSEPDHDHELSENGNGNGNYQQASPMHLHNDSNSDSDLSENFNSNSEEELDF
ncbi:cell division cycle protein 27 [Anaeramoeba flamelloides]|uniref:Cell division cycle protein 27 n=1 Tax=Anaeramoeba flamelloides TaxID=1746091 RepID=A0AAV7ZCE3_9EUKA|nr:cell division cycle protein 27 [Anaeramoeba flamelloides]